MTCFVTFYGSHSMPFESAADRDAWLARYGYKPTGKRNECGVQYANDLDVCYAWEFAVALERAA